MIHGCRLSLDRLPSILNFGEPPANQTACIQDIFSISSVLNDYYAPKPPRAMLLNTKCKRFLWLCMAKMRSGFWLKRGKTHLNTLVKRVWLCPDSGSCKKWRIITPRKRGICQAIQTVVVPTIIIRAILRPSPSSSHFCAARTYPYIMVLPTTPRSSPKTFLTLSNALLKCYSQISG